MPERVGGADLELLELLHQADHLVAHGLERGRHAEADVGEPHVAQALLAEGRAGAVAHQLMGEHPRHVPQRERVAGVLEHAAVRAAEDVLEVLALVGAHLRDVRVEPGLPAAVAGPPAELHEQLARVGLALAQPPVEPGGAADVLQVGAHAVQVSDGRAIRWTVGLVSRMALGVGWAVGDGTCASVQTTPEGPVRTKTGGPKAARSKAPMSRSASSPRVTVEVALPSSAPFFTTLLAGHLVHQLRRLAREVQVGGQRGGAVLDRLAQVGEVGEHDHATLLAVALGRVDHALDGLRIAELRPRVRVVVAVGLRRRTCALRLAMCLQPPFAPGICASSTASLPARTATKRRTTADLPPLVNLSPPLWASSPL